MGGDSHTEDCGRYDCPEHHEHTAECCPTCPDCGAVVARDRVCPDGCFRADELRARQ